MYFELNKNGSLVYQNFCMKLKQGINNIKCFYLKKERSQINCLNYYLKKLEKEQQIKAQMSRGQ